MRWFTFRFIFRFTSQKGRHEKEEPYRNTQKPETVEIPQPILTQSDLLQEFLVHVLSSLKKCEL